MIKFLTGLFKKPDKPLIYHALCDIRSAARMCGHVAYRHVPRSANQVADDMARRALDAKSEVKFSNGKIPEEAPANQIQEVYIAQGD